jgi:ubiquinone/menaquinone biosynthesis C-methylase UbiE
MSEFENIDQRMKDIINLLGDAPLDKIETVLDVGVGEGYVSLWFADKGKKVTAMGVEIDSYDINRNLFKEKNIKIIDSYVEKMPFAAKSFDAVVLSHVLEHCLDVSVVLQEVKRVLKDHGFLFLFVPPYSNFVISGHATTGWNVGQLIYVLLLNGFNVKTGKFIQYGYNVCAFVQKGSFQLPPLRRDGGDIRTLYNADLFPEELEFSDETFDGFKGDIRVVNWNKKPQLSGKQRILYLMSRLIPAFLRVRFIRFVKRAIDFLSVYAG